MRTSLSLQNRNILLMRVSMLYPVLALTSNVFSILGVKPRPAKKEENFEITVKIWKPALWIMEPFEYQCCVLMIYCGLIIIHSNYFEESTFRYWSDYFFCQSSNLSVFGCTLTWRVSFYQKLDTSELGEVATFPPCCEPTLTHDVI